MARRSRRLSAEEHALWQQVAATTRQLHVPLRPAGGDPVPAAPAPTIPASPAPASHAPASPAPAPAPLGLPRTQTAIPAAALDPGGEAPAPFRPPPFRIGEAAAGRTGAGAPPASPPRMDAKLHRRMSRGKLVPEARLDLHGLTLNRAQPVLTHFVLQSHAAGLRLLLVITGKGRGGRDDPGPLPVRPGALRHHVPIWLRRPPLSRIVLQADPAHRRHGGEGAYYVYLRK